jgi:hypothetical protein
VTRWLGRSCGRLSLGGIIDGVAEVRIFDSPLRDADATMACLIKS